MRRSMTFVRRGIVRRAFPRSWRAYHAGADQSRIDQLERTAASNPRRADVHARLMRALIDSGDAEAARAHYLNRTNVINEECAREYVRAMRALDRVHLVQWDALKQDVAQRSHVAGAALGSPSSGASYRHSGSSENDLPSSVQLVWPKTPLESIVTKKVNWRMTLLSWGFVLGVLGYIVWKARKGGTTDSILSMSITTPAVDVETRFDDVVGLDAAKSEVEGMVDYLRNPAKYKKYGAKLSKGLLLHGPPGTGKTLLARAMAGEAGVPFFHMSASQVEEIFVGLGAARIRRVFSEAKRVAPSIIFIDEIDSLSSRNAMMRHSGADQTLNQLLTEMDGFEKDTPVIVIAATNLVDKLDKALLRSGRFDTKVAVPPPDKEDRRKLFQLYLGKVKCELAPDVNPEFLARSTIGLTGADIANVVNRAVAKLARADGEVLTMAGLRDAEDDTRMGPRRTGVVMHEDDVERVAWHEGGHAIVSLFTPDAMPIRTATILPRGGAAGMVVSMPKDDRILQTRGQMMARLAVAMGGKAAEEIKYGREQVSAGVSSDLKAATDLARAMVRLFGMSDDLGPVCYEDNAPLSQAEQERVDKCVRELLEERYTYAKDLLLKHHRQHALLARELLDKEELTGAEVEKLVLGEARE